MSAEFIAGAAAVLVATFVLFAGWVSAHRCPHCRPRVTRAIAGPRTAGVSLTAQG